MEDIEHRNSLPKGFTLNEYRIESILGRPGGFGITYLAFDTNLEQYVAIKEYLPSDFAIREGVNTVHVKSTSDMESFQWGMKCFSEEARVLARFAHPHIVRVLRFFRENGTAYMVMEYQEGECLTDYLKNGPIPEEELLNIVLPLFDGLKKIHQAGYLHRDIKPQNVYIRQDKSPVLLDFGSARYAIGQKSLNVTSIVSPGYAPLEQYDNEATNQGPWTDIYALGGVMYFAITGEAPPAATRRVMKDPLVPAIIAGQGRYRRKLLEAIDWALTLDEQKRPQSVDIWQENLLPESPPVSPDVQMELNELSFFQSQLFKKLYPFLLPTSILILLLLIGSVSLLLYKNQEIQETQANFKYLEQELTEVKEEKQKEKLISDNIIQQLRADLEEEVKRYRQCKLIIERVKFFEKQLINELIDKTAPGKRLYYDITGIPPGDQDGGLVVREYPGHAYNKLGVIPRGTTCVAYLREFRLVKGQNWVYVRHQDLEGWVNSHYLTPSAESCQQFDKPSDKNNSEQTPNPSTN